MAKKQLDNLVTTGALKVEAPSAPEIDTREVAERLRAMAVHD